MEEHINSLRRFVSGPGLDITSVTQLRHEEGRALYRVVCGDRLLIFKWFAPDADRIEVWAYNVLRQYRVPTIPILASTENGLLMEDLTTSPTWRLATEQDNRWAETGIAVAEWYKLFHSAGRHFLANVQDVPDYLHRETDSLDANTILRIGARLRLEDNGVWRLAAKHIEELKSAMNALPTTFNYNDFEWTNLALSRQETPALRGIVFDYHLLGIGPVYCDYRNVVGSLEDSAREAFQAAFGPVDEREAILDAPLSVLYGLHVALQRPRLPGWATGLVGEAASGELELKLREAIHSLER